MSWPQMRSELTLGRWLNPTLKLSSISIEFLHESSLSSSLISVIPWKCSLTTFTWLSCIILNGSSNFRGLPSINVDSLCYELEDCLIIETVSGTRIGDKLKGLSPLYSSFWPLPIEEFHGWGSSSHPFTLILGLIWMSSSSNSAVYALPFQGLGGLKCCFYQYVWILWPAHFTLYKIKMRLNNWMNSFRFK